MRRTLLTSLLILAVTGTLLASEQQPELHVLVDGWLAPEYFHEGKIYIEALKGKEYAIRITNPLCTRIAVALAVDGLNTIDAHSSDAYSAKKWVLQPFETIVINGWQVNQREARRFFFTTEEKSYGEWLGKTQNLGVITAVFFRERAIEKDEREINSPPARQGSAPSEADRRTLSESAGKSKSGAPSSPALENNERKEDFAATGIGRHTDHDVLWVTMDLDPNPFARRNLRYEFRPVLAKLGVIPTSSYQQTLRRRERAMGFNDLNYCPEPR